MANKIVEDTFRECQEALAKLRRVIDQHEALQHDLPFQKKQTSVKEEPKAPEGDKK